MNIDGGGVVFDSRRMSRMPFGTCFRASMVMMFFLSKKVLSHRWKALFTTQASKMSWQRMMAKLPLDPPRFWRTTSSCPHTRSTIAGVSAPAPSIRREKRARMHANARLSAGSSRRYMVARLVSVTKSSRSMLRSEHLVCLVPCWRPGWRPSTVTAKVVYLSFFIVQLCPVTLLSSVLPFGVPPSPTVIAVVLTANALV